ncbi:T9SS type A sorting domain-containing protein [Maribellus comscasis]|uniref:T9SS type A sorting domain-containing protein n=1 Tax=Maribellus comscasis TaxID=2681766 RepID=A0A6I6K3B7_9BACT|nr:T9SS type A sorting domain-containing protein [Maribellus comscasis]QGY44424.1 T9SS type A sorting domain-containing protein [Maribellus comscasis]
MRFQVFFLMFLCSLVTYGQDIVLSSKMMATSGTSQNFNAVNISRWSLGEVHSLTFGDNRIAEINKVGWDVTSYPNPFTSELSLDFQIAKEMKVEIKVVDINGKKVYSQNNWSVLKGQTIQLNLEYLVSGTYLIFVLPEDEKVMKVFKVQKSR